MVIVKTSEVNGKGVFATKKLKQGQKLYCDVIEITNSPLTEKYVFPYIGNRVCIHAGFGSFFNSSKDSNVRHVEIDVTTNVSTFEITKDINASEELFLNY